eukprot:430678-Pyramimonas_sp.AAC.2
MACTKVVTVLGAHNAHVRNCVPTGVKSYPPAPLIQKRANRAKVCAAGSIITFRFRHLAVRLSVLM